MRGVHGVRAQVLLVEWLLISCRLHTMPPPLWPPSSWLSNRPAGPSPAQKFPGVDASYLHEVNDALRRTVSAHGWPDTYGRRQPLVEIAPGETMTTFIYSAGDDPFRLATNPPTKVLVGDRFFDTSLVKSLIQDGFSRDQVLVQALSHEAYHSNEGQHLQRCDLSLDLFRSPFSGILREQFSSDVRQTIVSMARVVQPMMTAFVHRPDDESLAERLKVLYSLHTKIDEGAADIYSMVVFNRIFPESTTDYLAALHRARRQDREKADQASVLSSVFIQTYDNASTLDALHRTTISEWSTTPLGCTVFALNHALSALQDCLEFHHLSDALSRMAVDLQRSTATINRIAILNTATNGAVGPRLKGHRPK